MEKMVFTIEDDNTDVAVSITKKNGAIEQKVVEIDDLITNLVKDFKISTGLLPIGTRRYEGNASNYNIIIETPAKIRKCLISRLYNNKDISEKIDLPFPTCLACFKIIDFKIHRSNFFALQNSFQTGKESLMIFPYGNVYENGNICWGRNALPKIQSSMELVSVINTFFNSEFNGDLFNINYINPPMRNKDSNVLNFWELIRYCETKIEFEKSILKKSSTTIEKLFE
jgi:hypothetical protein